jgi:hypothetical protein
MVCCDDDARVIDDDAVSCADLQAWSAEFENLTGRVSSLFVHPKSRAHARQYLEGLLAPIERKNGWTIAEHVGEKEPKAMQRFLNLASWDADALRDMGRDYAIEHLGDPEGILVADPTGFAKKGHKSAGVQRQYSGTLGRVDNCQIGTFLAYVNSAGDRVLIDRELYIPQESWFGDRQRCAEAAVPPDLEFDTRPAQVIAMIERTRQAGVGFRWFTADEEFGQNPRPARLLGKRLHRLRNGGPQDHRVHRHHRPKGRNQRPPPAATTQRVVPSRLRNRNERTPRLRLGGHRLRSPRPPVHDPPVDRRRRTRLLPLLQPAPRTRR